jgi:hypothetical protein
MDIDKWGKHSRIPAALDTLESYGAAAKDVLPQLRGLEKQIRASLELRKGVVQPQNTAGAQNTAEPAKSDVTAPAELARPAPASSPESEGGSDSGNG